MIRHILACLLACAAATAPAQPAAPLGQRATVIDQEWIDRKSVV